jgi:hypothetical protein
MTDVSPTGRPDAHGPGHYSRSPLRPERVSPTVFSLPASFSTTSAATIAALFGAPQVLRVRLTTSNRSSRACHRVFSHGPQRANDDTPPTTQPQPNPANTNHTPNHTNRSTQQAIGHQSGPPTQKRKQPAPATKQTGLTISRSQAVIQSSQNSISNRLPTSITHFHHQGTPSARQSADYYYLQSNPSQ